MGLVERLGVALGRVSTGRVPGAAAIVVLRPGDGMVEPHRPAGVGILINGGEDMDRRARIRTEIIPFVSAHPSFRQHTRRSIDPIGYFHRCLLNSWMAYKISTDEPTVPRPIVK